MAFKYYQGPNVCFEAVSIEIIKCRVNLYKSSSVPYVGSMYFKKSACDFGWTDVPISFIYTKAIASLWAFVL